MKGWGWLLLVAAIGAGTAAHAEPACVGLVPALPGHAVSQTSSHNVGLAIEGSRLALWPRAGLMLNAQAGVEIDFVDGTNCVSTFAESGEKGIALQIDRKVAVVEAAVCQDQQGMCIPVKVELNPPAH